MEAGGRDGLGAQEPRGGSSAGCETMTCPTAIKVLRLRPLGLPNLWRKRKRGGGMGLSYYYKGGENLVLEETMSGKI